MLPGDNTQKPGPGAHSPEKVDMSVTSRPAERNRTNPETNTQAQACLASVKCLNFYKNFCEIHEKERLALGQIALPVPPPPCPSFPLALVALVTTACDLMID